MRRDKQLRNRKGIAGGVRNRNAAYIAAGLEMRREFFMLPRDMRRYWDDDNAPLYGPCGCMSRYLKHPVHVGYRFKRKGTKP